MTSKLSINLVAGIVVLLMIMAPVLGQYPQSVQRSQLTPGTPLKFQVRVRQFLEPDSILQIYLHPQTQEIVRLYKQNIPVMGGNGETHTIAQQGLIRENGNRIPIPQGEFFFTMEKNFLYTESFQESRSQNLRQVNLKKYAINKQKLIKLGNQLDTLSGPISPRWHYFKGSYVASPFATFLAKNQQYVLTAWSTSDPSKVRINLHPSKDSLEEKSFVALLGKSPGLGLHQLKAFGLRETHLSVNNILLHCVYQTPEGKIGHLFSSFDLDGRLLWESNRSGDAIMRMNHPFNEVFTLSNRPVFHQFVHCLDAQTGRMIWEKSLYELYNDDPAFEFAVVNPDELAVLDINSVMGGEYLGVVVGRKLPNQLSFQDNRMFLFDRTGRMVYRYSIPESASFFRIKDHNSTLGLGSEKAVHRFWQ